MIPGSVCEARNATSKVASAKRASWSLVALCRSSSRASAICSRTFQRHRADAADNGLHLAVAGMWRLDREDDQESQGVREALERLHGGRHDPAEVFGGASRSPSGSCSRSWSAGQTLLRRPAAPFHPRSDAPRIISARVAASVIGALERHEHFLRLLIVFATQPPATGTARLAPSWGGRRHEALKRTRTQFGLACGDDPDDPLTQLLAPFVLAAVDAAFVAHQADPELTLERIPPLRPVAADYPEDAWRRRHPMTTCA